MTNPIHDYDGLSFGYAQCESPIERVLFLALYAEATAYHAQHRGRGMSPRIGDIGPEEFCDCSNSAHSQVSIQPQANIGNYRVDFLVSVHHPTLNSVVCVHGNHWEQEEVRLRGAVVVECDGHDYHERTKEQASKDKKRDRALQSAGYVVFRYTGSNIWNDSLSIAAEIIREAESRSDRPYAEVISRDRSGCTGEVITQPRSA